MPKLSSLTTDKVLTGLSIDFQNQLYVADEIAPAVNVGNQRTGIYYEFNFDRFTRVTRDTRAPGDEAEMVDYTLVQRTYGPIVEKALSQKVPQEHIDEADAPLDPMRSATRNITERLLIGREYRLATAMQTSGNFTNKVTLSGTSQWSDYTNSDPIGDVDTGMDTVEAAILKRPNVLLMGKAVFNKLRRHPDMIAQLGNDERKMVREADLAEIFGVDRVIVARASYNTAKEGQTKSISNIWGKHAWLLYINPSSSPVKEDVSFAYTFTMNLNQGVRIVDRWFSTARNSWYVRARENYQQKIVMETAAYAIYNAVA